MDPQVYDPDDESVSLIDIVLVLNRGRRFILKFTLAITFLSLAYAIFSPPVYTASAKVIRETPGGSQGVPSLRALSLLGIEFGGSTESFSKEIYPDILKSHEVKLAVLNTAFQFQKMDTTYTLNEYYDQSKGIIASLVAGLKAVTIELPGRILNALQNNKPAGSQSQSTGKKALTVEEMKALEKLSRNITVKIDRKSSIMIIRTTMPEPVLAADVVWAFIVQLQHRVRELYYEKMRENLEFLEKRFREAKEDLENAEKTLASFSDRNLNIATASLRLEYDRLQRQVNFKTNLFSELQSQSLQVELALKRNQPVITIVEEPLPPHRRSAPRRKLIVIVGFILGVLGSTGWIVLRNLMGPSTGDVENEIKLAEIRDSWRNMTPARWIRWLTRRPTRD